MGSQFNMSGVIIRIQGETMKKERMRRWRQIGVIPLEPRNTKE